MKKIPPIITPIAIVSIGLALGATTTIVNSSPTYGLKKGDTSTTTEVSTDASKDEKKGNSETDTTEGQGYSTTTTSSYVQETAATGTTTSTESTNSSSSETNRNNEGSTTTTVPTDNFVEQPSSETTANAQNGQN